MVGTIGAGIGINIVTDCVKTFVDYYNPNSNVNRIARLEKAMQTNIRNTELAKEVLEHLTSAVNQLNKRVERLEVRVANTETLNNIRDILYKGLENVNAGLRLLTKARVKGEIDPIGLLMVAPTLDMNRVLIQYESSALKLQGVPKVIELTFSTITPEIRVGGVSNFQEAWPDVGFN